MTDKTFEGSFARRPRRRGVRSRSGMRSLLVALAVFLGMGLGATAVFADPPPAGASTPAPTWTKVAAAYPTGPTIRFGAAMAYDPATSQLVLFGGTDNGALGTTWTWTGTAEKWTKVATTGPTARSTAAMAYDPATSQLLLFGGADNGALGTTWTWTGTAEKWTKVATTSIFGPRARTGAAMAYDPATSQLLLFGGKSASTTYVTTWAWTGIAEKWTFVTPTGPTVGNRGVSMAYDPTTGQLVLFGFLGGKTWTWTRTINPDRSRSPVS